MAVPSNNEKGKIEEETPISGEMWMAWKGRELVSACLHFAQWLDLHRGYVSAIGSSLLKEFSWLRRVDGLRVWHLLSSRVSGFGC